MQLDIKCVSRAKFRVVKKVYKIATNKTFFNSYAQLTHFFHSSLSFPNFFKFAPSIKNFYWAVNVIFLKNKHFYPIISNLI